MAKEKSETAAVERALKAFKALEDGDKVTVLERVSTGKPEMGLVNMAKVEEINAGLSAAGKSYLLAMMKQNAPKAE